MSSHKNNAKRAVAAAILLGGGVTAGALAVAFSVGLATGFFRDGPAPDADATRTKHEPPITPRRQERNSARIQTAAGSEDIQNRGDNVFGAGPVAIAGAAAHARARPESGEIAVGGPNVTANYPAVDDRAVGTAVGAPHAALSNAGSSFQNEGGGGPAAGLAGLSTTSRAGGGGGEFPRPGASPAQASKPATLSSVATPRAGGAPAPIVVAGAANPVMIAGTPNSPAGNAMPAAPKQPQVQAATGGSAPLPASAKLPLVVPRAPLSVGSQQSDDTVHAPLPVLVPVRSGNAPAGPVPTPDDLIGTPSSYVQTGGTTTVNGVLEGALIEIQGGLLTGTGSIPGNVIIGENGTMNPGSSPGTLQVGGYTQYGNLLIEIAGPTLHDLVEVVGTAKFVENSTITFKFISGYFPAGSLEIEFLRAGALEGLKYVTFAIDGAMPTGFYHQVWEDSESDLHVSFYREGRNSQLLAIPAPSTPALVLLGLTELGWQWRRSHIIKTVPARNR